MLIGILAVQGDFARHFSKIKRLGIEALEVKTEKDLRRTDGLIIPGGESTTIKKVLDAGGLYSAVRDYTLKKPVFGTCAGCIMLAQKLVNDRMETLRAMDIAVERNAYGNQIDSFIDMVRMNGHALEAVFIRAPIIREVGSGVRVLITHHDNPVLVRQDHLLGCTFHPELTDDDTIHRYFTGMVDDYSRENQ